MKKYPLKYQRTTVRVPSEKPLRGGICEACGRAVDEGIKTTHIHHHKYAYRTKTVKEKPELALENTSELCYGCHRLADALRTLFTRKEENMGMIVDTALLMPEDMKEKMDILCTAWLKRREGVQKKGERTLTDFV